MSWNYRVMRREETNDLGETSVSFEIHEVHYATKDSEGGESPEVVQGYTASAVAPVSEDLEGLRWVLTEMLQALDKPVLEYR